MTLARTLAFAKTLPLLALAATGVGAQASHGATPQAVLTDSVRQITALTAHLRAAPRDTAGWFRLGMLAWTLRDVARAGEPTPGLSTVKLAVIADSALHTAVTLAPRNAMYRLTLAKFLLTSDNPFTRTGANAHFSAALGLARAGTDTFTLAEAMVAAGQVLWRHYDGLKNRRLLTSDADIGASISDAVQPVARNEDALVKLGGMSQAAVDGTPSLQFKDLERTLETLSMPMSADVNGLGDYVRAVALFREADGVSPANAHAFRSYAMVLADSGRWSELDALASAHAKTFPWDPNAWLLKGLASERLHRPDAAAAAFDSAFAYLAPAERVRLDRIQRVLRPTDSVRLTAASATALRATSQMYWLNADPLWSTPSNESRLEFLARVTYADIRWTVDELGLRGADSDRGDVFVRYGPPDKEIALHPRPSDKRNEIVVFWLYKSGLIFSFSGMPTFSTMRTPVFDEAMAKGIKDAQPVRWDNVAMPQFDTLPARAVRFRGTRDSVDIVAAAAPPYDRLRDTAHTAVRTSIWLARNGVAVAYHDSTDGLEPVQQWTHRVAHGTYVLRVEGYSDGAARAARSASQLVADDDARTGFALQGFGVSDLMVARSAGDAPPGARWTAFRPALSVGAISRAAPLTLLWEAYDLGEKDGNARYTVSIVITRAESGLGHFAGNITGALAGLARVDTKPDKFTVSYDRTVPHAAAIGDKIEIGLTGTPAGRYAVTLQITDGVTGRIATASTAVVVAN